MLFLINFIALCGRGNGAALNPMLIAFVPLAKGVLADEFPTAKTKGIHNICFSLFPAVTR
jgi:hypothetical protein